MPWNIILYNDGVNPGDSKGVNQSRKCITFYWSFLELGMRYLCYEECWFELTTVRSDGCVSNLPGGITQIAAEALMTFFQPGRDVERDGIQLKIDNEVVDFWAKIGGNLGDIPAIKDVLSCKGHSGIKPCVICQNHVVPTSDAYAHLLARSTYAVGPECVDVAQLMIHTDATIRELAIELRDIHKLVRPDDFEFKEQMYGLTHTMYSPLLHERLQLKAISTLMYDWGHMYVCDGIGDRELGICMATLKAARAKSTYSEFKDYSTKFKWPAISKDAIDRLFTNKHNAKYYKNWDFSSTASEFLSLVPVLLCYFIRVVQPRGDCADVVDSFIKVLMVIEALQCVKRGLVTPSILQQLIHSHLQAFMKAYGGKYVRRKHHYVLHLPDMLLRFGCLIATFTHERKHRGVKRECRPRQNLKNWEVGVVESLTVHRLHLMSGPWVHAYLVNARKPMRRDVRVLDDIFPNARGGIEVSKRVETMNGSIAANDVVLYRWVHGELAVGKLLINAKVDGAYRAAVTKWTLLPRDRAVAGQMDNMIAEYQCDDAGMVIDAAALEAALVHRPSDDGAICTVVLPPEYRNLPLAN